MVKVVIWIKHNRWYIPGTEEIQYASVDTNTLDGQEVRRVRIRRLPPYRCAVSLKAERGSNPHESSLEPWFVGGGVTKEVNEADLNPALRQASGEAPSCRSL